MGLYTIHEYVCLSIFIFVLISQYDLKFVTEKELSGDKFEEEILVNALSIIVK